jgi:DNA-binding CsgD family transcriptional regulator
MTVHAFQTRTVRRADPFALSTAAGVDAVLATARREVIVVNTLRSELDAANTVLRGADRANLRRGVRYRVLLPDRVRGCPTLTARLTAPMYAGANIRTVPDVALDATVVDGTLAVLPHKDNRAAGVALLRLPGAVDAIVDLFERIWSTSVALLPADVPQETDLSARERELLALLTAGWTDESAAARLGLSVRTIRRTMSDIMHRLGARSRFQAGVKAVDRGWID